MPINPETQAELIDPGVALATDLSMQEPQIETIATSKRKLPRALLAVGLGISSLVASVASEIAKDDAPAADANFQENPPLVSGTQFSIDVGVEEGSSVIGNATAINKGVGGGFVSVFGDEFKGTSTVNTFSSDGSDVVMPNTFIANPGADGEIGVRVGGSSDRQVVIDKIAELRDNPFTDIFETPRRIKDTRNSGEAVVAGGTVEVEVGKEYAGDFAIVNLTVDRNDGKGWHATYPCSEGYQGTSSLNAKGEGAQAILNVVKVDKDGNICVRSQDAAVGTIVDHVGVFKSEASAFERLVDTRNRSAGDSPLAAGQERGYVVGTPNSVFLGTIVSANPSKRGNVAVYSEQGGNNGTSLLNSDGENTASNFVILETDENGMIWMQSTYNTEIVIDGTQMDELKGFVTSDNQRLIDARFDTITPEASIELIPGTAEGNYARIDEIDFKCVFAEVDSIFTSEVASHRARVTVEDLGLFGVFDFISDNPNGLVAISNSGDIRITSNQFSGDGQGNYTQDGFVRYGQTSYQGSAPPASVLQSWTSEIEIYTRKRDSFNEDTENGYARYRIDATCPQVSFEELGSENPF